MNALHPPMDGRGCTETVVLHATVTGLAAIGK